MAEDSIQVRLEGDEDLEFVRGKVRTGEYASEAEVVRHCVAVVREEEAELERWLQEVAAERSNAFHANPESAISVDELSRRLGERRLRRTARAS